MITPEITEQFVNTLGEDAPAVPTNAQEFQGLTQTQQMLVRQRMPELFQQLNARPESLPAAVSLRRQQGRLTVDDIGALEAAGLVVEAARVHTSHRDEVLADLQRRTDEQRARREAREAVPHEAELRRRERLAIEQRRESIQQSQSAFGYRGF